ncbi:MAG: hypothetical protein C5B59_05350 [Bacteroidetes bacterium]|nr:MAG: hypothetical protein C5B59_05350 [Bacteroidota bacterium]
MKQIRYGLGQHPWLLFILLSYSFFACKKETHSSSSGTPAVIYDTSFETGGSNYAMYSVGTYLQFPTDSDWNIPYNLRPVIGTYHLAPDTVKMQLAKMYANGQRKIALDLWYLDFSLYGNPSDSPVNAHVVNSKLGKLMPQQESNLKNLLIDIINTGFNTIILRFATQGNSASISWNSWDQSRYDVNWSFIRTTIQTVQQQITGKPIDILFDLDLENGGNSNGQAVQYNAQLWTDYVKTFGSHHTIGFSIAYNATGKVVNAMKVYDQVGVRPDIYGFDVYGDELAGYTELYNEMKSVGEDKKPVFAEEAFYDDALSDFQIRQARSTLNWNIKWIMQWPEQRYAIQNNFSVQFPADYSNYLK